MDALSIGVVHVRFGVSVAVGHILTFPVVLLSARYQRGSFSEVTVKFMLFAAVRHDFPSPPSISTFSAFRSAISGTPGMVRIRPVVARRLDTRRIRPCDGGGTHKQDGPPRAKSVTSVSPMVVFAV